MSASGMFPDPAEPPPLVLADSHGPWGGPTYSYRGARIECCRGEHVCGLFMPGHPLHGHDFGVVGIVTALVDI